MNSEYSLSDIAAATGGGNNRNGGWGDDWAWIIILLLLAGGRGFGGFGGFGGGGAPCATQADIRSAVDQQTLISKLDQQTYGLADSTYALNNTITNGFHGVDNALCNLGYQTQQGFNTLGSQLMNCCCETQRQMERGFCDLGQTINMQTRDIIENQNANYRGLMDFMVQEKLAAKDAEIAQLTNRLSQSEQNGVIRAAIDASTAEIIRRTGNECPVPAYVVPNPNCCYGNPVGVGFSGYGNNGCGNGNF